MTRRSRGSGKQVKARRLKAEMPKRRNAPKATRNRDASIAGQGKVVAKLTRERDEALLRETANAEILRLISRSPGDLELVFRSILEHATRICNANFGTLFRFDGENFYPVAQFNTPVALLEALTRRGPFKPTPGIPLDHVMRTKQAAHSADEAADPVPGLAAKLGGARTQVTVPMLKDDALIGAILIYRQEVRPFTDKQIELLESFARQAVIAIENARLLNELRQSLEQQTATSEVLRVISSSHSDLAPVFETMLANATRLCDATFGSLLLYEGNWRFRVVALSNAPPALAELRQREPVFEADPKTAIGRAVAARDVVHIADYAEEAIYKEQRHPAAVTIRELGGARTFLVVPMLRDREVVGAVVIYRQQVRPFADKQIELVKNFAAQAVIAVENARLLNELREALENQTTSADILRTIASFPASAERALDVIAEATARRFGASNVNIRVLDGNVLRYVGSTGPMAAHMQALFPEGPIDPDASSGKAILERRQVYFRADSGKPGLPMPSRTAGITSSVVATPLMREGQAIGVLIVNRMRSDPRPFTESDLSQLSNFAAQAVIAIENARLLSELRESLEQQTAAAEVLRVISTSPGELEPVFAAMLANATRLCEAPFGGLFLRQGDFLRFATRHVPPSGMSDANFQWGPGFTLSENAIHPLARVVSKKEIIHLADLRTDESYIERNPRIVALVESIGARSFLFMPMLKDNECLGAFGIFRQEVRPFTDRQIDLVKNFAAQAVIAIENARLLNELRQRTADLTESLEQQTATSKVLQVISGSPGALEPVFDAMLENALRICEAKSGNLFGFEGNAFHLMADLGTPPAFAEFARQPRIWGRDTVLGQIARGKQAVHIIDLQADDTNVNQDPGRIMAINVTGARTVLAVPMLRENQLIGAFVIFRQEVRAFTDKQIALVQNFAAQAVIAIENARLLDDLNKLNQQLEHRVADQVVEIEHMSRLRRFLPPQVADLIVASGTEKQLESHRREITALFCDLRGFTGFSESADPEDVMALLRDYHAAIGEIVVKYSGTLERFAGDGVMVIFNDPVAVENPALQAVLMALDMRTAIGALIEKWRDLGHDLGFGIGIAHGFATLGTIGFEGRFDYAAIGTVSNVASRLCDEAKPGQILISPRVRQAVDKAVRVESVGEFELKGIRRPMLAYNVLESSPSKPN